MSVSSATLAQVSLPKLPTEEVPVKKSALDQQPAAPVETTAAGTDCAEAQACVLSATAIKA